MKSKSIGIPNSDTINRRIENVYRTACLMTGNRFHGERLTWRIIRKNDADRVEPALLKHDRGIALYRKLAACLKLEHGARTEESTTAYVGTTEHPATTQEKVPRLLSFDFPVESETAGDICGAVGRLPANLRFPFLLKLTAGLRYDEIASVLQIDREAARERVQGARRLLESLIATVAGGEPASEAPLSM